MYSCFFFFSKSSSRQSRCSQQRIVYLLTVAFLLLSPFILHPAHHHPSRPTHPPVSSAAPSRGPLPRYFEVVSSNRKNSVFLRAKDPAMAQSWYNAILAGTANLLPRVKEELRTKQPGMDVKHVGWITEQVWRDKGSTLPSALKDNVACLRISLNSWLTAVLLNYRSISLPVRPCVASWYIII